MLCIRPVFLLTATRVPNRMDTEGIFLGNPGPRDLIVRPGVSWRQLRADPEKPDF